MEDDLRILRRGLQMPKEAFAKELLLNTNMSYYNTIPADGEETAGPQETPAQRNLRLLKEVEDEEQAFQRKTMTLAMEMAKGAAEESAVKIRSLEAVVGQMQEAIEEMRKRFQKEIDTSRKREDELGGLLSAAVAENKRLALAVEEAHRHSSEGEKHRKDLEEAIFYLQDEIIKNKPKPVPPPTPAEDAKKKKK